MLLDIRRLADLGEFSNLGEFTFNKKSDELITVLRETVSINHGIRHVLTRAG
jgi:hypothetical protein